MSARTNDPLAEARRLAGESGFVIAEVTQYGNPSSILDRQPYTAYVLYRKLCRHLEACRCRGVRVGRRKNPVELLKLIREQIDSMKAARV